MGFANGYTVTMSPKVTLPLEIDPRIPPPFTTAISMGFHLLFEGQA